MKTDLELIVLAAKAANIRGKYVELSRGTKTPIRAIQFGPGLIWNPLDDDGLALRLAVKLDLDIRQFSGAIGYPAHVLVSYRTSNGSIDLIDEHGDDAMSATRRAIVLVAAEIGERMP